MTSQSHCWLILISLLYLQSWLTAFTESRFLENAEQRRFTPLFFSFSASSIPLLPFKNIFRFLCVCESACIHKHICVCVHMYMYTYTHIVHAGYQLIEKRLSSYLLELELQKLLSHHPWSYARIAIVLNC